MVIGYTQPSLSIMQGSDIGGEGGRSYVYWDTSKDTISGGVGNSGGIGSRANSSTNQTASGTGGLLIIFASELENNNEITAKGVSANPPTTGTYRHTGAASGGGSINIFLKGDSNKMGTINADGGLPNGGKGCISIGNIATGSYISSN